MQNSFSSDTKNEIAHSRNKDKCCNAAEVAGFIRACGSVTLAHGKNIGFRMSTENAAVARRYKSMLETEYGIKMRLMVGEAAAGRRTHVYELSAPPSPKAEALLISAGIISISDGKRKLRSDFGELIMRRKCCRKACLKGLFLGSGTVNDPDKGYSLEISLSQERTALAVKKLMGSFTDINAGVRPRRSSYVVYLKDSEQIKDILTIIGAGSQLFKYENTRVMKEVRERANRLSNCDAANMERALSAAQRQIEAIDRVERGEGLDSLPDELIDTALTRIFHPDASLSEIGALLNPPIGKAAVSARFKQIEKHASVMKKKT